MRVALLAIFAACASTKEPTSWRHVPTYHIDSADDVRWPAVRAMFVGTVRHRGTVVALKLDDDPAGPSLEPRFIALHGVSDLADGARVAVSGVGRRVERDEAAAGAVISIADVEVEDDIAAPAVAAYPLLRRDADLSVMLAQTYVTSEGVVIERNGQILLQLPSGGHLRLWVTACDGETEARSHVEKRRRVYGRLVADGGDSAPNDVIPTMGIGFPTFE